jgi:hypothetical protein
MEDGDSFLRKKDRFLPSSVRRFFRSLFDLGCRGGGGDGGGGAGRGERMSGSGSSYTRAVSGVLGWSCSEVDAAVDSGCGGLRSGLDNSGAQRRVPRRPPRRPPPRPPPRAGC